MSVLQLPEYSTLIHLNESFHSLAKPFSNQSEKANNNQSLINWIKKETIHDTFELPNNSNLDFNTFRAYLNMRLPNSIDDSIHKEIDNYIFNLRSLDHITDLSEIPRVKAQFPQTTLAESQHISLWQGDITLLRTDSIVNAANSGLLGCFRPLHKCIDNCIHTFAGPRLRRDCALIMEKQGFEEPTAEAKITRGYLLPARYVIHTVGPIWGECNGRENELLAQCYTKVLDLASQFNDIKSVAFCCISTGVFGFPNEEAAKIAVSTVSKWLHEHPGKIDVIVFNVFKDEDLEIYSKILSQ